MSPDPYGPVRRDCGRGAADNPMGLATTHAVPEAFTPSTGVIAPKAAETSEAGYCSLRGESSGGAARFLSVPSDQALNEKPLLRLPNSMPKT